MKDSMDSTAVGRAPEPESFTNRKLIRPTLPRGEQQRTDQMVERRERAERAGAGVGAKKTPPPETTHAENFYYQKQMQAKTPMVIVLNDGERISGVIEWYDRSCIKLNRTGGNPNLLIYKSCIKYLFKEAEQNGRKG
jgi:sRNA-binding regulator protein Hfq